DPAHPGLRVRVADAGDGGVDAPLVAAVHHDVGAGAGETRRDGVSDALGRAGDQCGPSCQVDVHVQANRAGAPDLPRPISAHRLVRAGTPGHRGGNPSRGAAMSVLSAVLDAARSGAVRIVDLTTPLRETTPIL